MSDCERYSELIQDDLDDRLDEQAVAELRAHLASCAACAAEAAEFEALRSAFAAFPAAPAPAGLKDDIMAALPAGAPPAAGTPSASRAAPAGGASSDASQSAELPQPSQPASEPQRTGRVLAFPSGYQWFGLAAAVTLVAIILASNVGPFADRSAEKVAATAALDADAAAENSLAADGSSVAGGSGAPAPPAARSRFSGSAGESRATPPAAAAGAKEVRRDGASGEEEEVDFGQSRPETERATGAVGSEKSAPGAAQPSAKPRAPRPARKPAPGRRTAEARDRQAALDLLRLAEQQDDELPVRYIVFRTAAQADAFANTLSDAASTASGRAAPQPLRDLDMEGAPEADADDEAAERANEPATGSGATPEGLGGSGSGRGRGLSGLADGRLALRAIPSGTRLAQRGEVVWAAGADALAARESSARQAGALVLDALPQGVELTALRMGGGALDESRAARESKDVSGKKQERGSPDASAEPEAPSPAPAPTAKPTPDPAHSDPAHSDSEDERLADSGDRDAGGADAGEAARRARLKTARKKRVGGDEPGSGDKADSGGAAVTPRDTARRVVADGKGNRRRRPEPRRVRVIVLVLDETPRASGR